MTSSPRTKAAARLAAQREPCDNCKGELTTLIGKNMFKKNYFFRKKKKKKKVNPY
jgi:hypothetical protein